MARNICCRLILSAAHCTVWLLLVPGISSAEATGDAGTCAQRTIPSPIALFDVIERVLCQSPKTRVAWAEIKAATANVGASKAAYLPSLGAEARYVYQHETTHAGSSPQLESDFEAAVNEEALSLSWVLYDFGARSATLADRKQRLLAARANQDATVQAVFASTARDYFAAQSADTNVGSTRHIESLAGENLNSAIARVNRGVAPITDQLQANTALAQAVYERVKAEGQRRSAIGSLAVDMSLSPTELLILPELDTTVLPNTQFVKAVDTLLDQARLHHPKILLAAARWQAALENVHFARAQGSPLIRLVGESDRSNQPVSASLGQPSLPATTRNNYVGIKIEIPLFDGLNRSYQVREAQAQAQVQEEGLRDAQQQVAIGVWTSVQALQNETENLRNTDAIQQSASAAFEAARHRYNSGVGSILELISAESTLASAERQRVQAQLEWRTARIQLAASLGNLGMWAVE